MAVAIIRILNNSPTMKFISGDVLIIIFILFITRLPQSFSTTEAIQPSLTRLDSKRLSPSVQESAAKAVLGRLLPTHLLSFHFKIVSKDVCGGQGCFLIENYDGPTENGPEILIKGTTAVEIASGLHWYIKYFCGAHVSWDKTGGVQLASVPKPGSLPLVKDGGVLIQRPVPWNYYQNVVTSSYSYVWWDWERWEKEIDWMALQGINLPLAFSGQEAIWQKVFMGFNISMEDLNDFFGGPAFLAWARMGNLHTWGGPLSKNWLKQQLVLQKKILSRMAELGMTPVLPSFSGNVPAALKTIFPTANITRLGDWNTVDGDPHWCCTYLLNPSDPLFVEIGEAFIKMQIKEYGDVTDIYNCDTFNENSPPTNDTIYISSLGAAVYKAMSNGDKDAVWLMQGWLFYSDSTFWKPPQMKALLHSVPVGKMIVLDLFADVKPIWATSSQFYGTPYVWCLLHNFGGNIEMYGTLDAISSGPVDARISKNSTMVGVGMCMEGIEQNPVVYEFMSEMAFRKEKVPVLEWLKTYTHRRYGKSVQQIKEAWAILYHTVYNCTDGIADHNIDFIVKFPDWDPSINFGSRPSKLNSMHTFRSRTRSRRFSFQERSSDLPQAHLWYSTHEVVNALKLFLAAGNDLAGSLTYRYDLVDLTRQVLSKLANQVYLDAINAFRRKDVKALNIHSQKFIQLIKDIDVLLASDDNFLLGTWLESAKLLAENPSEMRQYEWNARTQVTMWFDTTPTNQSKLHDYANKFWSGLLEGYYLPRASSYFSYLFKSLEKNESFKLVEWRPYMRLVYTTSWAISVYYAYQRTWKPFNPILGETYEMVNHGGITFIAEQVSHHPPMSAGHAENEHFIYDISSKVKTKFLGNSIDIYPLGRTRVTLKRDGTVFDLVPPPTKVNNLIFGRTWVDSPGEMIMTNLTTGDKAVLYFQPCGWFGAGRYEIDGYVYNSAEEPKILMTGKWNESMSYQPCDSEGEPLPGTELKEAWKLADAPKNDKFQYTHFAHKINSFDTAPKKLLASDSRLRPDRYALELGDLSKAGFEKSSLEERQRAEKKNREEKGHKFTPKWFDFANEVAATPWGDLEVYQYNGKYTEHRAAIDGSSSSEEIDIKSTEFNPWQYEDLAAN